MYPVRKRNTFNRDTKITQVFKAANKNMLEDT